MILHQFSVGRSQSWRSRDIRYLSWRKGILPSGPCPWRCNPFLSSGRGSHCSPSQALDRIFPKKYNTFKPFDGTAIACPCRNTIFLFTYEWIVSKAINLNVGKNSHFLTVSFSGHPMDLKKDGQLVSFLKNGHPAAMALSLRVQPPPFFRYGQLFFESRTGQPSPFLNGQTASFCSGGGELD